MSDNYALTTSDEQSRTLVLVIYGLYLAAIISFGGLGIAGIAGVVIAYIKRDDVAPGSIWHTHYLNQIAAFWIWLVLMIVGGATWWMLGLGFIVMGFALLYFMYRTLKGLVRALDSKPY